MKGWHFPNIVAAATGLIQPDLVPWSSMQSVPGVVLTFVLSRQWLFFFIHAHIS